MNDLALQASATPSLARRPGRTAMLAGALIGGCAIGILFGRAHSADPAALEGPLVLLLRFMAFTKAAAIVALAALVLWRLSRPLGATAFSAYLASLSLMAAAPGLIWFLGLVAPGALVFHGGLLAFLVGAARDDGVRAALPRR